MLEQLVIVGIYTHFHPVTKTSHSNATIEFCCLSETPIHSTTHSRALTAAFEHVNTTWDKALS